MLRYVYICLFFLCFSGFTYSQEKHYPFGAGEDITYKVYYHLGFVWLSAAQVSFSVNDTLYHNKNKLCLKSQGASLSSYSWIFSVKDHFLSIVDKPSLQPLVYYRNTKEGSHSVNNRITFNSSQHKAFTFVNDSDTLPYHDTVHYKNYLRDVLTSVYYVRNIPFEKLEKGSIFNVKTIMDHKIVYIKVDYLGKEEITHKNKNKYWSYKIAAQTIEGSIFAKNQKLYVWISTDKNRIPLKISSEILVGSVEAYLDKVKNIHYPQSSIMKDFAIQKNHH